MLCAIHIKQEALQHTHKTVEQMFFIYLCSCHNIVNISWVAHLVTWQNPIQVCVKDIMFKPWLTLGQTGGVTMAPLFAQADRQMVTGFLLTITHRKEEINSKYKNAFSLRLRHSTTLSFRRTSICFFLTDVFVFRLSNEPGNWHFKCTVGWWSSDSKRKKFQ